MLCAVFISACFIQSVYNPVLTPGLIRMPLQQMSTTVNTCSLCRHKHSLSLTHSHTHTHTHTYAHVSKAHGPVDLAHKCTHTLTLQPSSIMLLHSHPHFS